MKNPENIIVSACLLGCACRYDGKEKAKENILALLEQEELRLIPVCPEQLGGLATPRVPSERKGDVVINARQEDVTLQYKKGAQEALKIARLYHCKRAILKEKSPSCGHGRIYDGSFRKVLIEGNGVTAELFLQNGIEVLGESDFSCKRKR